MLKNVYSRGVGGQKRAKFSLRSFWTTPYKQNFLAVSKFARVRFMVLEFAYVKYVHLKDLYFYFIYKAV